MNKGEKNILFFWLVFLLGCGFVLYFLFYNIDYSKIFIYSTTESDIFFKIRLPRLVASFFVGAGLSVVGCVLQSVFLNPLCEGYTLGISSSAALGVVVLSFLNFQIPKFFSSLGGVLVSTVLIYVLVLAFRKTIDIGFVLVGIVLNFFFSGITILFTIFFDPYKLHYILLWLLGSFSSLQREYVYVSSVVISVLIVVVLSYSNKLDIIVLGKEKSISLGVEEDKVKGSLIFVSVIISAICVSLAGVISFIGIIVPNIVKSFVGLKHKKMIFYSALFGGILVTLCDGLAKNLYYPIEIPISVFTGIIGSVFFVVYLISDKSIV